MKEKNATIPLGREYLLARVEMRDSRSVRLPYSTQTMAMRLSAVWSSIVRW
jgi:hypothetical protein